VLYLYYFGGAFLVTDEAFAALFESVGHSLEELSLQEAAKVSRLSLNVLATKGNLKSLKLKRCHGIDEECLKLMSSFKKLTLLKLIEASPVLPTEPLVELFASIGEQLTELSLSG
jgi:hypothetical protein